MKSVKVSGLLEEIGTLYEDGTMVVENESLIKGDFVEISEDIIRRLNAGGIMCGKIPCKKIRITSGSDTYETSTNTFIVEGTPVQNGEPKLSLPIERWGMVGGERAEVKQNLKQILAEIGISYVEIGR